MADHIEASARELSSEVAPAVKFLLRPDFFSILHMNQVKLIIIFYFFLNNLIIIMTTSIIFFVSLHKYDWGGGRGKGWGTIGTNYFYQFFIDNQQQLLRNGFENHLIKAIDFYFYFFALKFGAFVIWLKQLFWFRESTNLSSKTSILS